MDPILTGTATNIASETAKGIFFEIKRHVRYIFIHKKMVEQFEEKMKLLIARRESVKQEIIVAERNLEKTKADVEFWCKRVDKMIDEESNKVKELEGKAKSKCFLGLCPNIKSRYQLNRKAEVDCAAVGILLKEGEFDKVAVPNVLEAPSSAASGNFKDFDSRKKPLDEIMEALNDPTIKTIGVYGPGGVGKTTLVDEVARQVKEATLFASVVKETVNETSKIEEIQDTIAESLGLKLDEKSRSVRAGRLSERLKKEKNILIVLDNLWAGLSLIEVGICFEDQQKGCKILMTSRNRNVLTDDMHVNKTIGIGVLEEQEAWDLFEKVVENDFEDSELLSVATEVVKRCGGLPLAIATIASALRNKALHQWKDASRQLQRPSPTNFIGIPAAVYSAIELSYNQLESEELRPTFLLSCLLGQNVHIDDLLRWAMGLHLFIGLSTVEETRNKVLTMVSKLKASCLLIDSYDNDHFSMHDFVHDAVLAIAYKENHAFALKDWPDEERMERFKMIALNFASIKKLLHQLNCPQLSLLAIDNSSKDSYEEMPTSCFEKMKNIRVLDLVGMSLSSSISDLQTSLRTLCLKQCRLKDMINLGNFQNLEILSLSSSIFEMLPEQIGQLKRLRLLDLSRCTKLRIIPLGVLSSLSNLEELYMNYVEFPWNEPDNAHLDELKELTSLHIKILDASLVPKDLFFEKLQKYNILIGEGWYWEYKVEYSRTVKLKVNKSIDHLDDAFKCLLKKTYALYLDNLEGVKIVLNHMGNRNCILHLEHLHIQDASEVEYIMNDDDDAIDKIAFRRLQSLALWNLPQLISFCSRNSSKGSTSVPQLETLPLFSGKMELPCLENLLLYSINVGRIWHSNTHLTKLTSLVIRNCGNLKYIFSSSMATSLVHLKSFEISHCKSLTEIIFTEEIEEEEEEEEEKNVTILFPQLSAVTMWNLEHLIGFCSENYNLRFPSLKRVDINVCPNLEGFIYKFTIEENQSLSMQALFNKKVECPNLVQLKISSIKVKRIWDDQPSRMSCYVQNLEQLTVNRCDNLGCLFTSLMLPLLKQLQSISIEDCGNIEEVICMEEVAKEDTVVSQILPKLRSLYLYKLPKLMTFCHCHGNYLEFPLLIDLTIESCPTFKTFISDSIMANENDKGSSFDIDCPPLLNEKGAFPRLQTLKIHAMVKPRRLWPDGLTGDSFSKLKLLELNCCYKLVNVFPFIMSKRLQNLEELIVDECNSLEEIFEPQTLNIEELHAMTATNSSMEETTTHFAFPKLTHLTFARLPKLKRFYRRVHTTEWPSLKEIWLHGCDMVEILFASELTKRQTLFLVNEVTFPNLENLQLLDASIGKIWHGQLQAGVFSKLKVLELRSFTDMSDVFPHCFIQSLPDIQKLTVANYDFSQIFIPDGFGDNEIHALALTLNKIRYLIVQFCGNLKTLVPPLVSFENLTELEVSHCKGLVNLMAFSTAKSLVQLTKMMISYCIMMEQIIGGEGDEVKGGIVFTKVKYLKLMRLPRLSSFCSRDHDLEFPALETMIVSECPKMKNFCQGDLSTPQLQKVKLTEYAFEGEKWRWEGNLDTTIRGMFEEMNVQNSQGN